MLIPQLLGIEELIYPDSDEVQIFGWEGRVGHRSILEVTTTRQVMVQLINVGIGTFLLDVGGAVFQLSSDSAIRVELLEDNVTHYGDGDFHSET